MEKNLKYLGVPIALFICFTLLTIFGDQAVRDFILRTVGKTFDFLPYIISVGAWLSAAILLNRLLNLVFWNMLVKRVTKQPPPRLLVQMSNLMIYILASAGIIGVVFEQSLTGLFATSGVIGLILGFALRSLILDLFSGLSINLERPFVVGDFIQVYIRGVPMRFGIVQEINWRTTKLITLDNSLEIIPNSVMGTAAITNLTGPTGPVSRFQMTIGFDFSVEPERVLRLINAGLRDATRQKKGPMSKPGPKVKTSSYEKGNIQYKIKYFVDTSKCSPGAARAAVLENVFRHVRAAGLKPAYDKSDVYEASVAPLLLDTTERIKETLRQSVIADVLTEDDMDTITRVCTLKSVPPGGTVLAAGEVPQTLQVLNEGILDAVAPMEEGGAPETFSSHRTGDLIGAMVGSPAPHEVVASSPVSVIEIPADVLGGIAGLRDRIEVVFAEQDARHAMRLEERKSYFGEEKKEEARQTSINALAGKVRGFFKSRMRGHFSSTLRTLAGRDPHQQLVHAALASCALVAAADGDLDQGERDYIAKTLNSLDLFHDVTVSEGMAMFESFVSDLLAKPEQTRPRLLDMIARASADHEMAVIILEVCKAVSASDGHIDAVEEIVINEIAAALGEPMPNAA